MPTSETIDAVQLDDKYCDETSDAALISSNGTTFLVMKYYLMAASSVFRDALNNSPLGPNEKSSSDRTIPTMHASPSRVTITLSDQYFDTSRVIRAVLGILDGTWKPKAQITGVIFMERILLFAEKWNCALLLDYTLQSLFNFLDIDIQTDQEGQSFIRIFIIGAKHNLLPLCKAAITSAPLLKWKELHPFIKLPANTDPDQWILDPTGWPSELAADTPSLYLWALRRAIKSYDSDNSYIADQLREIAFPFEGLVKGHGNGLKREHS